jgi:hypothetical protein
MTDLISRQVIIDLIDAELAAIHSEAFVAGLNHARDLVSVEPAIKPQVVANISGGVLQGASSDYPVDLYALDFDVDTFDEDSTGIIVNGDNAYLGQTSTKIDPDFIKQVVEAEEINFATGEAADA